MGRLLLKLLHTLRRNLMLFAAIVLVLAAGGWLRGEWRHIQRIVGELPALRTAWADAGAHQAALAQALAGQAKQLSGAGVGQLDAQIRVLDQQIASLQRQREETTLLSSALQGGAPLPQQLRQAAMRDIDIELRRQQRAHLLRLRGRVDALANRAAALDRLEQRRLAHVRAYAAYQDALRQRAAFADAAGLRARIAITPSYWQLRDLDQQVRRLRGATDQAHKAFLAQQGLIVRFPAPGTVAAFQVDEARLAMALAPLRARLLEAEQLEAHSAAWQAWLAVRPVLPVAFGVLAAWWLVPAAIRTLFYFVLAPLAARRPPLVIAPGAPATRRATRDTLVSAVSHRVCLAPGHALLIRPEYCQSQPAGVAVSTALMFDWRHPFTSIAAHLWMLRELRATRAAEIVVSSTVDPLEEVALLEVGAGEAVVLQPRALVGLICKRGQRPAIRSHWRLGTLHAWLTLQLRYLAFEGPATLVLHGRRGVRLEQAAGGRTISQDATLGFSAGASYATVRAEPFLPYLRGRQALLHDRFAGDDAWYLYEEVPRNAGPDRQKSNPLEVLLDAGLKAFGI